MLIRYRYLAPEGDDAGGGGAAAGGADLGGGAAAGADAGGTSTAPTMDDTARETYRALMGGKDEDGDDAEGGKPKPAPVAQPRDKGKFAKAAAATTTQAPKEGAAPLTDEQQQQAAAAAAATTTQPQPHDALPNTWSKDLAEKWKTADPELRAHVHKREQDFHNGIRQYKDAAGFGQSMAQEFMPYRETMQKMNVRPQEAVRDVMRSLNVMATGNNESKAAEFLKLAKNYGISLDAVMSLHQRAPSGETIDLSPVTQRVDQLEHRLTQADEERQQLQRQDDEATINRFISDPKHPHAEKVRRQMGALMLSGEAETLDEAYEKAIWQHPEVRAELLQEQDTARRKKEAEEVAAAKRASGTNVQRRGTPPVTKAGSMEDTARTVYRRLLPSG